MILSSKTITIASACFLVALMVVMPVATAQRITAGGGGGGGGGTSPSPVPPGIYYVTGSPVSGAISENITFVSNWYPGSASASTYWSVNGASGTWISSNVFQFNNPGDYTVTFTVSSIYGSASESFTEIINYNLNQETFVQYGNVNSVSKATEEFTIPTTSYLQGGFSPLLTSISTQGMIMFVGIGGTGYFPINPLPISTSGSVYDPQAYASPGDEFFSSGIAIVYNTSSGAPFIFGFTGLSMLTLTPTAMMSGTDQYSGGLELSAGNSVVLTTICQPDPASSGTVMLTGYINDTSTGSSYSAISYLSNSNFPDNSAVWGVSPVYSNMAVSIGTGGIAGSIAWDELAEMGAGPFPLLMPQVDQSLSVSSASSTLGVISASSTNVYGMSPGTFYSGDNTGIQYINPPDIFNGGYSTTEFNLM